MVEPGEYAIDAPDRARTTSRVAIVDLADDLQVRKQWIFKIVKRLGIFLHRQRGDSDRRNQLVSTVSYEDVVRIRGEIAKSVAARGEATPGVEQDTFVFGAEEGLFYLLQLEPTHDANRIKVGFTTDLDGRLRKHRCAAPYAMCLKSWPCRRTWERAAIDCMTAGSEQLYTEVFRVLSLEEVVGRGNQFFALMPPVRQAFDTDESNLEEAG